MKSKGVGLIVRAISFQDFQPMWSWSTNVTGGQTTCDSKTMLCTIVHHAVKTDTEIMLWGQKGYYNNSDNCPEMRQQPEVKTSEHNKSSLLIQTIQLCLWTNNRMSSKFTLPSDLLNNESERKSTRLGKLFQTLMTRWLKKMFVRLKLLYSLYACPLEDYLDAASSSRNTSAHVALCEKTGKQIAGWVPSSTLGGCEWAAIMYLFVNQSTRIFSIS